MPVAKKTHGGAANPRPGQDNRAGAEARDRLGAHLAALQAIADAHSGTRACGTPGFDATVDYVVSQLRSFGYRPRLQTRIPFPHFENRPGSLLTVLNPASSRLKVGVEYHFFAYTPAADVTGVMVDVGEGFDEADFASLKKGDIALIHFTGRPPLFAPMLNAERAGAAAIIIAPPPGVDLPTAPPTAPPPGMKLGYEPTVPLAMVGPKASERLQKLLSRHGRALRLRVNADVVTEVRSLTNVVAGAPNGTDSTVIVGAHTDSVLNGPGMNDNGTGVAAALVIAQELSSESIARQRLRFVFFGGEETGLQGSQHYVRRLPTKDRAAVKACIILDTLGSHNPVRYIRSADRLNATFNPESPAGPPGSKAIEKAFAREFERLGLAFEVGPGGDSDFISFMGAGIPCGGIMSGLDDKTPDQVSRFGGASGAMDPYNHTAQDTLEHVNLESVVELTEVAAAATLRLLRD